MASKCRGRAFAADLLSFRKRVDRCVKEVHVLLKERDHMAGFDDLLLLCSQTSYVACIILIPCVRFDGFCENTPFLLFQDTCKISADTLH